MTNANAVLTIDLAALRKNYADLRDRALNAECAAVVKADAYGVGVARCGRALFETGCRTFFVATPGEGIELRAVVPEADIYILDGLFPGSAKDYGHHNLRPVLGSLPELIEWADFNAHSDRNHASSIHVDTGMNRVGLIASDVDELAQAPRLAEAANAQLLMSHLACADEPGHQMNAVQLATFNTAREKLPAMPSCLANSAGIFLGADYHFDMVRPGIALYGGRALQSGENPMAPVVALNALVTQVKRVGAGQSVGYGAVEILTRDTVVATLGVGYADGYFRLIGAGPDKPAGYAYINDTPAPILGRISMDMITIDVTDVAYEVKRGNFVELIGSHISVDDVAALGRTIGYEVLTALGRRYQRLYLDEPVNN